MLVSNDADIYAGETPITKVYAGSNVVYEKQTTPYTPLNYLKSTGTQWIDTGIKGQANLMFDLEFMTEGTTNYIAVFGERTRGSSGDSTQIYYLNAEHTNYYKKEIGYSNIYKPTLSFTANNVKTHLIMGYQRFIIETEDGDSYTNNNLIVYIPSVSRHNIYMFCFNDKGIANNIGETTIYSFKISVDDTLVRDFIPVLDENGVPCMYDKVSETYFYNQGTGTFLYG